MQEVAEDSDEVNQSNLSALVDAIRSAGYHVSTTVILTFVYPCIASIIVNDDQQDATILLIYSFLVSSACFG